MLYEITHCCPMCGETVTRQTVECPYCGEALRTDSNDLGKDIDRKIVEKFHREARALAGFWIFLGIVSTVIGWLILSSGTRELMFLTRREQVVFISLALILLGCASLWCGVMTAMKRLLGVKVGLRVSYLSALLNLGFVNVPGALLICLVIMQAHRVLKNGRLLQEAGLLGNGENA